MNANVNCALNAIFIELEVLRARLESAQEAVMEDAEIEAGVKVQFILASASIDKKISRLGESVGQACSLLGNGW